MTLYVADKKVQKIYRGTELIQKAMLGSVSNPVLGEGGSLPEVDISNYINPSIIAAAKHNIAAENSSTYTWKVSPNEEYYRNEEIWTNALKNYILGEDLFYPVPYLGEIIESNPYTSLLDCNIGFTSSQKFTEVGAVFSIENTSNTSSDFNISLGGNTGYNFIGSSDISGLSAKATITFTSYPYCVLVLHANTKNIIDIGTKIYLTRFGIKI